MNPAYTSSDGKEVLRDIRDDQHALQYIAHIQTRRISVTLEGEPVLVIQPQELPFDPVVDISLQRKFHSLPAAAKRPLLLAAVTLIRKHMNKQVVKIEEHVESLKRDNAERRELHEENMARGVKTPALEMPMSDEAFDVRNQIKVVAEKTVTALPDFLARLDAPARQRTGGRAKKPARKRR